MRAALFVTFRHGIKGNWQPGHTDFVFGGGGGADGLAETKLIYLFHLYQWWSPALNKANRITGAPAAGAGSCPKYA